MADGRRMADGGWRMAVAEAAFAICYLPSAIRSLVSYAHAKSPGHACHAAAARAAFHHGAESLQPVRADSVRRVRLRADFRLDLHEHRRLLLADVPSAWPIARTRHQRY